MKKQFSEQCADSVLDKIAGKDYAKRAVEERFSCTLEEKVISTGVPDDFDHKLTFTVNYPGEQPSILTDTNTLTEQHHVGIDYLVGIKDKLLDYPVVEKNFDIELNHIINKDSYEGIMNFTYKRKQ